MTKKAMVEQYPQVSRERDNFMLALNDQLNGDITWSGWHRENDLQGKYRVGVSRMDSAAGGLMLVTYRHPGQGDYTTCQMVDELESIGFINSALLDAIWEARNSWHSSHQAPKVA